MGETVEVKKGLFGTWYVSYKCPRCNNELESDLKHAGASETCPICRMAVSVPGAGVWQQMQDAKRQGELYRERIRVEQKRKVQEGRELLAKEAEGRRHKVEEEELQRRLRLQEEQLKQGESRIRRESEPTPQQSEQKEFLNYNAQRKAASTTGTPQLLGIIGSIALCIGVFMPIVSTPIGRSLNYFQNGKGDGTMVLLLAVISFFLALTKGYQWLWLTGLGSFGDMLFMFVNVHKRMSQVKTQVADDRFQGAIEAVQLQWGWAVLVVGAGLLIAAAVLELKETWYELDPPGQKSDLPAARP